MDHQAHILVVLIRTVTHFARDMHLLGHSKICVKTFHVSELMFTVFTCPQNGIIVVHTLVRALVWGVPDSRGMQMYFRTLGLHFLYGDTNVDSI